MTARFIDWIWHIRGDLALAPGQSSDEAFERLAPLFQQVNTSHERTQDRLTFTKKDQAAQDKMSVFDRGTLTIERDMAGPVLRYHLVSRTLLFCFLAPFLFLAIGGAMIGIGMLEKANAPVETKAEKAKKKAEEEAKEKKRAETPMNPIDKFLGAPEPEKKEKDKDKAKGKDGKEKDKKEDEEENKGPSPTPAYVFAGIFATLYVGGRILEDRLIRSLFRKRLAGL